MVGDYLPAIYKFGYDNWRIQEEFSVLVMKGTTIPLHMLMSKAFQVGIKIVGWPLSNGKCAM